MSAEADWLDAVIKKDVVVLMSKSTCPYCTKAKDLLKEVGCDYTLYELDLMGQPKNGPIQQVLGARHGAMATPQLYVGTTWEGEWEAFEELHQKSGLIPKIREKGGSFGGKIVVKTSPTDGPQGSDDGPCENVRFFKNGKKVAGLAW